MSVCVTLAAHYRPVILIPLIGKKAEVTLEGLKETVRRIGSRFPDREERARRLYLTERPASLHREEDREFAIKTDVSNFFKIPYAGVAFCGSGQLGFSINKNKLFEPGVSDLDAACIDAHLFQQAWMDVIASTRAFTDLSAFGLRGQREIDLLQDQIVRRGMIRINAMPQSLLSRTWVAFQNTLSGKHTALFQKITIAIYINEYAFCWKQDSALCQMMRD